MKNRSGNNKNLGNTLKIAIGDIGIIMHFHEHRIKRQLEAHYKKFISNKTTDIEINVKCEDFSAPKFRRLLLKNRSWEFGEGKNCYAFYFPRKGFSSLAKINNRLINIQFYTQDSSYQLLFYLFPQILLAFALPEYHGLIFHSCGVIRKGKGYLFIAPSGGGKSTIARLSGRKTVLNDDRILIRKKGGRFAMFGTPWNGEFKGVSNASALINKVFFLKKAGHSYALPLTFQQSVVKLLNNVIYLPTTVRMRRRVFEICSSMAKQIKCYTLGFTPKKDIWRFIDGPARRYPEEKP